MLLITNEMLLNNKWNAIEKQMKWNVIDNKWNEMLLITNEMLLITNVIERNKQMKCYW